MRCTNTLIANFDSNTALTAGNLVVATRDARSFGIPCPRYQGNCANGSQREKFRAIKPGSDALRGNSEHPSSVLERDVTLRHPLGQSMPSHQLFQWLTVLGVTVLSVTVLGSAT
ncbi:MAG: hypothetical protein ACI9HK_000809 [Pirellulaceae bacterium]|jgi:hypothetical protein